MNNNFQLLGLKCCTEILLNKLTYLSDIKLDIIGHFSNRLIRTGEIFRRVRIIRHISVLRNIYFNMNKLDLRC